MPVKNIEALFDFPEDDREVSDDAHNVVRTIIQMHAEDHLFWVEHWFLYNMV